MLMCGGAAETPANEVKADNGDVRSAKVFKVCIAPLIRLIKLGHLKSTEITFTSMQRLILSDQMSSDSFDLISVLTVT